MTPAEVLSLYRAQGATIATAESCTGGMLAADLTAPAGASSVFQAGYVTYSNAAKMDMLGVDAATLETFGAVSEETAREMALGALKRAGVTVGVSITGIAGPGPSAFKPEGRVCFAVATESANERAPACKSYTCDFGSIGRDAVRASARDFALDLLAKAVF